MMFRKQRAWKRKEENFGTRKSSDSAEKQINRKNNIMKEVNIAWRQYHGTLLLEEENLLQKLQVDNNSQTISKCKPGILQKILTEFDKIKTN